MWFRGDVRRLGLFVIALTAIASAHAEVRAQADFRRGDANIDGLVDIADVNRIARIFFLGDLAPSCFDATDANDSGNLDLEDEFFLFNYLFLGGVGIPPPGPDTPGPDPNPGGCAAYAPAPTPPLATFALGLECPGVSVGGEPGSPLEFRSFATLTTSGNTVGEGAQAWSIGIGAEGLRILSVTTAGTAAEESSIRRSEVVDPMGAASVVVLDMTAEASLPPEGTVRVLALTLEATVPEGEIATGRIFFTDGRALSGRPVPNRVALHGMAHVPEVTGCEVRIGDCNANGQADVLDISTGASLDCTANRIPDECEPDCDGNSKADSCDIAEGRPDCDRNGVPDSCDIASGAGKDCNSNGVLDSCELAAGAVDCNSNGVPDSCDRVTGDCDSNGIVDYCEIAAEWTKDCDGNFVPDVCDLAEGASTDCNANGIPDICDASGSRPGEDCNANGTADACEIVSGAGADADQSGVLDECEVCFPKNAVECQGSDPGFRLGFRGPCSVSGEAGTEQEIAVFGTIETHCLEAGSQGAQGWALSIAVEGSSPVGATTEGTAGALTVHGGFRNVFSSFERTEIVDPSQNAGKMGVVSAVALDTTGLFTLPPEGRPHDVVLITLEATIPGDCGECIVRHEDGLRGTTGSLQNLITYQGLPYFTTLNEMRIELCSADGGGLQKPGDENQDGEHNLSDPISVLNHLFVGSNPTLPCGNGSINDAGNLAILDLNGNGKIDVSDPVYSLNFLFSGGPAPEMGEDCLRVKGCPEGCRT